MGKGRKKVQEEVSEAKAKQRYTKGEWGEWGERWNLRKKVLLEVKQR